MSKVEEKKVELFPIIGGYDHSKNNIAEACGIRGTKSDEEHSKWLGLVQTDQFSQVIENVEHEPDMDLRSKLYLLFNFGMKVGRASAES